MNDADGNPIYPRNGVSPPGWSGIYCVRLIPKPWQAGMPGHQIGRRYDEPAVDQELCRGEIVGRTGEERCSFCGARPVWA
jgi:hypothetical protein